MDDYLDYLKKYPHNTPATVFLFLKDPKGLRLEAPGIFKKFFGGSAQRAPQGSDSSADTPEKVEGVLYYYNTKDLNGFDSYSVSKINVPAKKEDRNHEAEDAKIHIIIQFFKDNSQSPIAEFVSEPVTLTQALDDVSMSGKGFWTDNLPELVAITDIEKTYVHHVPASALLLKNSYGNITAKAVRVEVPAICKEFTDGASIGKDPDGFLYYNNIDDLVGNCRFLVMRDTKPDDNTAYLRIAFYTAQGKCFAEFLGEDPDNTISATGLHGHTSEGIWRDLEIGSATASITKDKDEDKVVVTVGPIHKVGTISNTKKALHKKSVDVKGTLYFRNIESLSGNYANYNDDRIVFYKDEWHANDFYAYFIPFEDSANALGLSTFNTKILETITWTDAT